MIFAEFFFFFSCDSSSRLTFLIWPQTNIFAGHTKLVKKRELVWRCGGTAATRRKHPAPGFFNLPASKTTLDSIHTQERCALSTVWWVPVCLTPEEAQVEALFRRGGCSAIGSGLQTLLLLHFGKICSWIAWRSAWVELLTGGLVNNTEIFTTQIWTVRVEVLT